MIMIFKRKHLCEFANGFELFPKLPLLLIIYLCGIFVSCSNRSVENEDCKTINVVEGLQCKGKLALSDIVSDFEVIKLSNEKECQFVNTRWLTVGKNVVVIGCDITEKVLVFNSKGQFLRSIASKGKGPGQYQGLSGVSLCPKENVVAIGDSYSRKVLLYSVDGTFIKEKSLQEISQSIFIDGLSFLTDSLLAIRFRRPAMPVDDFSKFAILDQNLDLVRYNSPCINREDASIPGLIYASFNKTINGFMFWEEYYDTIYSFDKKLESKKANLKFDFGNTGVSPIIIGDINATFRNRSDINYLWKVFELKSQILAYGVSHGEHFLLVWDKTKNLSFSIPFENNCKSNFENRPSIINDLYAIEPVHLRGYQPDDGILLTTIEPKSVAADYDFSCLRMKFVTNPAKRDSLFNMIQGEKDLNYFIIKLLLK
ncbi:MAG: 6-bladed beta-propeller [Bacteroidia bacterium]|nr:6-bladed beta-propeller [Bacteroidia bacterium]